MMTLQLTGSLTKHFIPDSEIFWTDCNWTWWPWYSCRAIRTCLVALNWWTTGALFIILKTLENYVKNRQQSKEYHLHPLEAESKSSLPLLLFWARLGSKSPIPGSCLWPKKKNKVIQSNYIPTDFQKRGYIRNLQMKSRAF